MSTTRTALEAQPDVPAMGADIAPEPRLLRHVILASSLGAMFEWYDFFLYGSLAEVIAGHFFSGLEHRTAIFLTLLAFAAGLIVRPLGALVFGSRGDAGGRKQTFLITLLIMGGATFLVGCLPTFATAGVIAPIALVTLRLLQGLALGGEYGGAATFVAEHVPPQRRGMATSWIQTSGNYGLLLSLLMILACRTTLGPRFETWGWRLPFLFSSVLLVVSIYIRLSLHESPVFLALKRHGTTSRRPLREAFGTWKNLRQVLLALFGVAIAQAMVTYTCDLYALYFLTISLKIDSTTADTLLAIALAVGTPFSLLAGWLADRVGRKPVILIGCVVAGVTFLPIFQALTHYGNPALERAVRVAPVQLFADPARCSLQFDPVGHAVFKTACDVAKTLLADSGVPYRNISSTSAVAQIHVGQHVIASFEGESLADAEFTERRAALGKTLASALEAAGYRQHAAPEDVRWGPVLALLSLLMVYVSIVYGPLAAWLVEMFPARIRYSSISLPYHIGFGWIGGLLPAVVFAIVTATGNIYAGLYYPIAGVLLSSIVGLFGLRETLNRPLTE
jgi:MFS family permease